jgi:hypothetical protein
MISGPADWLSVTPASGMIEPQSYYVMDVNFDATDLADGTYDGQLTVTSNDPSDPTVDVPVTLIVSPENIAIIDLDLSAISDSVMIGGSTEVDLQISNLGNIALTYTLSDDQDWIEEAPTGGSVLPDDSDLITVTLDASALSEGQHTGTITITSNDGAGNDNMALPVTLEVVSPPGYMYLPGDANMYNGTWPAQAISSDVTYMVNYLRNMPTSVPCMMNNPQADPDSVDQYFWASADANGSCTVTSSDITKLVNVFRGQTSTVWCGYDKTDPENYYVPMWPTVDDLPVDAPEGWSNPNQVCQQQPVPAGLKITPENRSK